MDGGTEGGSENLNGGPLEGWKGAPYLSNLRELPWEGRCEGEKVSKAYNPGNPTTCNVEPPTSSDHKPEKEL